jgi:hypothetical protein
MATGGDSIMHMRKVFGCIQEALSTMEWGILRYGKAMLWVNVEDFRTMERRIFVTALGD